MANTLSQMCPFPCPSLVVEYVHGTELSSNVVCYMDKRLTISHCPQSDSHSNHNTYTSSAIRMTTTDGDGQKVG